MNTTPTPDENVTGENAETQQDQDVNASAEETKIETPDPDAAETAETEETAEPAETVDPETDESPTESPEAEAGESEELAAEESTEPAAKEPAEPTPDPGDTTPVAGLIFDLDGTLIDSAADIAASVNAVLESMERETKPVDEVSSYIGDGVRTLLERALETDDDEILDTALGGFFEHYSEHYLDQTVAVPGVKEILDHFKDKQCAVVSNKPEIFCRAILNGLGIDSTFVAIIGGDTTEAHKPDPIPIHEALALMGIEAEEVVLVGDGINDIEGGRAAGTRTCAVTFGLTDAETLAASNPDYTIDELSELARLFS